MGLEVTTEGIRTTVARGEKNYENQSAFPKVVGNNVAIPNLFTDGRGREKVVSAPPCTNNKVTTGDEHLQQTETITEPNHKKTATMIALR